MKLAHSSLYSFPPSIPSKSRYNYSITEVLIARFFFCVCVCVCVGDRTVTVLRPDSHSTQAVSQAPKRADQPNYGDRIFLYYRSSDSTQSSPLDHPSASFLVKKETTSLSRGLRANGTYFLSLRNRCQCGSYTYTIACA